MKPGIFMILYLSFCLISCSSKLQYVKIDKNLKIQIPKENPADKSFSQTHNVFIKTEGVSHSFIAKIEKNEDGLKIVGLTNSFHRLFYIHHLGNDISIEKNKNFHYRIKEKLILGLFYISTLEPDSVLRLFPKNTKYTFNKRNDQETHSFSNSKFFFQYTKKRLTDGGTQIQFSLLDEKLSFKVVIH